MFFGEPVVLAPISPFICQGLGPALGHWEDVLVFVYTDTELNSSMSVLVGPLEAHV